MAIREVIHNIFKPFKHPYETIQKMYKHHGAYIESYIKDGIRSKEELVSIMNSPMWTDPYKIDPFEIAKLARTFPQLDKVFTEMNADQFKSFVEYVGKFADRSESAADRLIGLFSGAGITFDSRIESVLTNLEFVDYTKDQNAIRQQYTDLNNIRNYTNIISNPQVETLQDIMLKDPASYNFVMNCLTNRAEKTNNLQLKDIINEVKFLEELSHLGIGDRMIQKSFGKTFIQNTFDVKNIPQQGFKLHISASNKEDYIKLLRDIVPDLIECGATFKVLNLSQFDKLYQNPTQAGKAITIYQSSDFRAREFFERQFAKGNDSMLLKESEQIIGGDAYFGGRIFGRYGRLQNPREAVVDYRNGKGFVDSRETPVPYFLNSLSLDNFVQLCEGYSEQNVLDYKEIGMNGEYIVGPECGEYIVEPDIVEPEWDINDAGFDR